MQEPSRYSPSASLKKRKPKYCVCNQQDTYERYLVCEIQSDVCLVYYHAKCIGLNLVSDTEIKAYSNCPDNKSFVCPACKERLSDIGIKVMSSPVKGKPKNTTVGSGLCDTEMELCEVSSEGESNEFSSESDDSQHAHSEKSSHVVHEVEEPLESLHGMDIQKSSSIDGSCSSDEETGIKLDDSVEGYEKEIQGTVDGGSDSESTTTVSHDSTLEEENEEEDVEYLTMMKHLTGTDAVAKGEYFEAETVSGSQFQLTVEEWDKMKPSVVRPKTLHPSWTVIVRNHIMNTCNPYCVINMKRHHVTRYESRKTNTPSVFKATGKCSFADCTVQVKVSMKSYNECDRIVNVQQEGRIRHKVTERRSHQFRGEERKNVGEIFSETDIKPSTEFHRRMATRHPSSIVAGNRSGTGVMSSTLRKIASEARNIAKRADKNVHESLEKLKICQEIEEKRRNPFATKVCGYIQSISASDELSVHMWTERQVRIWHYLCDKDAAYLDATGSVVGNWKKKRVLYYALVVKHPHNKSPIPVAEMLTTVQHVPSIVNFLNVFRHAERKVFGHKNCKIPRQINTDRSRALMLATIQAFNLEDIESFSSRAYRTVRNEGTVDDFNKMIPHACCSHMMKDFQTKIRKTASKDTYKHFLLYACSLLVNSKTLEELKMNFKDMCVLLSCSKVNEDVKSAYDGLKERTQNLGKDVDVETSSKTDDVEEEQERSEFSKMCSESGKSTIKNPFAKYFDDVYKEVMQKKNGITFESGRNKCFNEELLRYIISIMPLCSYWSGILSGSLSRYKHPNVSHVKSKVPLTFLDVKSKTQGQIENYFKLVKYDDFRGKGRFRADEFISQQYKFVSNRISTFADELNFKSDARPTARTNQKKRYKNDDIEDNSFEMAKEEWKKPMKSAQNKTGIYQNPPRKDLSDTPAATEKPCTDGDANPSGYSLFLQSELSKSQRAQQSNDKGIRKLTSNWNSIKGKERAAWRKKADVIITQRKRKAEPSTSESEREKKRTKTSQPQAFKESTARTTFAGLENLGNTCWLNSILQCLCSSRSLYESIVFGCYENTRGVGQCTANTLQSMNERGGDMKMVRKLHTTIINNFQWRKGDQQDADEALTRLLDLLNEDSRDKTEGNVYDRIVSLVTYTCICTVCTKESKSDTNRTVTLPMSLPKLSSDGTTTIQKCFDKFLEEEECDIKLQCNFCAKKTRQIRKTTMSIEPEVLVMTIKRYTVDGKLQTKVHVDREIFTGKSVYCVRAILTHSGQKTNGGHYIAIVKKSDNKFYEMNDNRVSHVKAKYIDSEDVQCSCYIVMYERKSSTQQESPVINVDEENDEEMTSKLNPDDISMAENRNDGVKNGENNYEGNIKTSEKVSLASSTSEENASTTVSTVCDVDLRGADFRSLSLIDSGWLTDSVILAYLKMSAKTAEEAGVQAHVADTHLITQINNILSVSERGQTKARWEYQEVHEMYKCFSRAIDISTYDFIIVPYCQGENHWCVIVFDNVARCVKFYDPLSEKGVVPQIVYIIVEMFQLFYKLQFPVSNAFEDYAIEWDNVFRKQTDLCSCGMFVLMYVDNILGFDVTSTVNMKEYRHQVSYELFNDKKNTRSRGHYSSTGKKAFKLVLCTGKLCSEMGKMAVLRCRVSGPQEGLRYMWHNYDGDVINSSRIVEVKVKNTCQLTCSITLPDGSEIETPVKLVANPVVENLLWSTFITGVDINVHKTHNENPPNELTPEYVATLYSTWESELIKLSNTICKSTKHITPQLKRHYEYFYPTKDHKKILSEDFGLHYTSTKVVSKVRKLLDITFRKGARYIHMEALTGNHNMYSTLPRSIN